MLFSQFSASRTVGMQTIITCNVVKCPQCSRAQSLFLALGALVLPSVYFYAHCQIFRHTGENVRSTAYNTGSTCSNREADLKTLGPFFTRKNKPCIIRERSYLYEYQLQGQDKPRLEKAMKVDFVPFIRGFHVLCKPRPE